jgi:phage-related protein
MTATYPAGVANPDFGASLDLTLEVAENVFGDGYTQRNTNGLNSTKESWSVSWKNMPKVEMDILEAFIRTQGGWQAFFWTPLGETTPKKWTCRNFKKTPVEAGYFDASATWKREFDPGA